MGFWYEAVVGKEKRGHVGYPLSIFFIVVYAYLLILYRFQEENSIRRMRDFRKASFPRVLRTTLVQSSRVMFSVIFSTQQIQDTSFYSFNI